MKLPKFDMGKAQWDAWKAFHINVKWQTRDHWGRGFTYFDTGEVICTVAYPRPWMLNETYYADDSLRGVRLQCAQHTSFKFKTPDGEKVKTINFGDTHKYLLIDEDTKRVVRLGWYADRSWQSVIPKRFHGCCVAYFPGSEQLPVGSPFALEFHEPCTKEEKEKLKELRTQCIAWWVGQQMKGDGFIRRGDKVRVPVTDALTWDFPNLTDQYKRRVALVGFKGHYKMREVPYLEVV